MVPRIASGASQVQPHSIFIEILERAKIRVFFNFIGKSLKQIRNHIGRAQNITKRRLMGYCALVFKSGDSVGLDDDLLVAVDAVCQPDLDVNFSIETRGPSDNLESNHLCLWKRRGPVVHQSHQVTVWAGRAIVDVV